MAAGLLAISSFTPARDRQGRLVPGARMDVYANRTTTRVTVYADAALTTPLPNPVVANASGMFPAVWAQAGTAESPTLYTLAYSGAAGESIGNPSTFDDIQPSVSLDLVSGETKLDVDGGGASAGIASNLPQADTALQARTAPALSLARAGRTFVDVLRRVPDLALARAGSVNIAPYIQAEMNDWGAAEFILDNGNYRLSTEIVPPAYAALRGLAGAVVKPTSAFGNATNATGGFAIRINQPGVQILDLQWDGSVMGAAGCIVIDVGANTLYDIKVCGNYAEDAGAFFWDRGSGDGTVGVGRHQLTDFQANVMRRARSIPVRCHYGFGFLNYDKNNVVDRNGSTDPSHTAVELDFAPLSALSAAGGFFSDFVMLGGGTAPTSAQKGMTIKNGAEITLREGTSCDGLAGDSYTLENIRLFRPQYIISAFCDGHGIYAKNVETWDGGRFEHRGRYGLPGAAAGKHGILLEGTCANFEPAGVKIDGATGNGLNRAAGGMPLIHFDRFAVKNCGRRAFQLSGGSGSFTTGSSSSQNNNLTGIDATSNYETTSTADKIMQLQLPSGGVIDVTTVSAG